MSRAGGEAKAGDEASRALEDYRAKAERELGTGRDGLPMGDPASGVLLALEPPEPPESPAVLDALRRSLDNVGHSRARVVAADDRLSPEILSGCPAAIVAVGPGAVRALDDIEYPLARSRFSEARDGEWFVWSRGAHGLSLPALAPALEDEEAKREFWRAFLALRALVAD
jgi:hypothetical protein